MLERDGVRARSYRVADHYFVKRYAAAEPMAAAEIDAHRELSATQVTPPFVAADPTLPILVTAYLHGQTLLEGASGEDMPERARALGDVTARLIDPGRRNRSTDDPTVRQTEARRLADAWPRIEAWAAACGAAPAPDPRAVLRAHANPAVVALTQGDPAPTNVLFPTRSAGAAARLIDFEYAAHRAALFDLAQWHIRCPLLPEWLVHVDAPVRDVYRGNFATDLATAKVHAALYMLSWLPIDAARDANRPWAQDWSVREALISTCVRIAALQDATGIAAPAQRFAAWFGELAGTLQARWPECGDGRVDWTRHLAPAPG